jgi:hypothetical protein
MVEVLISAFITVGCRLSRGLAALLSLSGFSDCCQRASSHPMTAALSAAWFYARREFRPTGLKGCKRKSIQSCGKIQIDQYKVIVEAEDKRRSEPRDVNRLYFKPSGVQNIIPNQTVTDPQASVGRLSVVADFAAVLSHFVNDQKDKRPKLAYQFWPTLYSILLAFGHA